MCSLQQAIAVVDRRFEVLRYWRQTFDVNKYSRPGIAIVQWLRVGGQAYKYKSQ
jgi:hypothetical protein